MLVLAMAFSSWLISFYIHHPMVEGSVYSDIVSFWHREPRLQASLIPCLQYFFEYPPASCLITYVSRMLGGGGLVGYYVVFSLLSLPAYIGIALTLKRFAGLTASLFIIAPSMVLYGVYNFDHFLSVFLIASLLAYTRGRIGVSAFFLGLGFSVKLFTVLLLPILLAEVNEWRRRLHVLFHFIAGALPFWLPVLLLNPRWLPDFLSFHASWGLENSWIIWLSNNPFSPSSKFLGFLTAAILVFRAYGASASYESKAFLVLSGFLIGSPTFTPQMVLWLIPLIAANTRLWLWLPLLEAANAGIILTWFATDSPIMPWTPPQTMSLLRAAALIGMWMTVYRAAPIGLNHRQV